MIHLDYCNVDFLPALVVGFDVSRLDEGRVLACDAPRSVLSLRQQAGSFRCTQHHLLGHVLRLAANTRHGHGDLREFADCLNLANTEKDRSTRTLRRLSYSTDHFSKLELIELNFIVGQYIRLPQIEAGEAAIAWTAPCDPSSFLSGWLAFTPEYLREGPPPAIDFTTEMEDFRFADEEPLDDSTSAELRLLGRELGFSEGPRIFLLWENID